MRREMLKAVNEGLPIRGFQIRSKCASHAIVINDGKITVAILPKSKTESEADTILLVSERFDRSVKWVL